MRKLWWVILLCGVRLLSARAQTVSDAQAAFRDSLVNHHFVLRNFSGEPQIRATWTGNDVQMQTPRWHIFTLLLVRSVAIKNDRVEINCIRHLLVRDETGKLAQGGADDEVKITVNLNGSDPATVLPQLSDKLFFASLGDALAAVPADLQQHVPPSLKGQDWKPTKLPQCDCALKGTDACTGHDPTGEFIFPRAKHIVDPGSLDHVQRERLNGSIRLVVTVDPTGHVSDVWVVTPLGLEMAVQAEKTVRQYDFAPATCHGQPAPTSIHIDMDFRTF